MGWIARAPLASAVSNAGAMGIIETSSGELDVVKDEIRKMRDLTDKPFGVNIAQVHDNWKNAIVAAAETDTIFLNRRIGPGLRCLRTEHSEALEYADHNAMSEFARAKALYFGGDMNASVALTGQVAGRIESVRPVAEIIGEVAEEFFQVVDRLAGSYPAWTRRLSTTST